MTDLLSNVFGYLACIFLVLGYLPQAYHTIRTRETDGIAMPTFLSIAIGSLFFVVQGILLNNWPLFITNAITTISSIIITVIKIKNDYFTKK
jgi:MtN3 and saliva related transmembrane protein